MNKKIYKGYELIKALADENIEAGTILIFTSTIDTTNKIEVEVARKPQGLILYKRNTIDDILPSSWLLNSKIEVLEDNTEEIEELDNWFVDERKECREFDIQAINLCFSKHRDKINELVKAVNAIRKENKK